MYAASRTPLGFLAGTTLFDVISHRSSSRVLRGAAVLAAIGAAGLPVFAASPLLPPGVARLLGPTGGFLLAYPLAAFVTGWLAERRFDRRYTTSFLAMLGGLTVVYLGGTAGVAIAPPSIGLEAAIVAVTPFAVADLLKLIVAAGVLPSLWQLVARTR